jgi:outer membrane protein assembly factor BamB
MHTGTCRRLATLAGVSTMTVLLLGAVLLPGLTILSAEAADWPNSGGDSGRNGLSSEIGPTGDDLLWSGGRSSLIAWQPVTEGNRAFMVRQLGWPYQQPGDSPVVAVDLSTGQELWAVDLPYADGDWTTWIAGARDGKVYASRSGNGASVPAHMVALDVTSGETVWTSQDMTDAGAYDGVVFAPGGDLIVASFRDIWRIRAADGTTAWHASRVGSVSGSCGGALFGDAFYVADAAYGGHVLVRYDAGTGARLYQSPLMPGFTLENTPMVGPDGTVYLNRAQNNASVDLLYAFADDGTQFVEKWHVPAAYNPHAELGVGPDGSVYAVLPGPVLARLDPATGAVVHSTPLTGFSSSRFAIDAAGTVFFNNGAFSTGRFYSFNPDLTLRWSTDVANINIGGPALGQNGTIVICGVGTDVRAFRTVDPAAVAGLSIPASEVQAYPNPFVETCTIRFRTEERQPVTLDLFDAAGRKVRTLLRQEPRPAGMQEIRWEGRDDDGRPLAAGAYVVRLASPRGVRGGKVLITR